MKDVKASSLKPMNNVEVVIVTESGKKLRVDTGIAQVGG